METNEIKSRFGIMGNSSEFLQAIDTAVQVAPIQLSVLITGESGSGKEVFPQIIHAFSLRKHRPYVAVNCGAIPEGTIDSELFGHEKGAFTGALSERKGYFEEANTGTIFLDEIGELPMSTQAKLLRVLEKGEYMRVGSSVVKKTDVRVVAATNVDLERAIVEGRFREDLYYRLNGIQIRMPPLRRRVEDIAVLFHKFTNDFADKNHMPPVRLSDGALDILKSYDWPGNIRQLKNVTEQVTVLAPGRVVDSQTMASFIPVDRQRGELSMGSMLPQVDGAHARAYNSDRELLYKILFDMRNDVTDLKKLVLSLINNQGAPLSQENMQLVKKLVSSDLGRDGSFSGRMDDGEVIDHYSSQSLGRQVTDVVPVHAEAYGAEEVRVVEEQSFSIIENERELIRRALAKHRNNRRKAATELQISERTLYRKIHDYGLEEK